MDNASNSEQCFSRVRLLDGDIVGCRYIKERGIKLKTFSSNNGRFGYSCFCINSGDTTIVDANKLHVGQIYCSRCRKARSAILSYISDSRIIRKTIEFRSCVILVFPTGVSEYGVKIIIASKDMVPRLAVGSSFFLDISNKILDMVEINIDRARRTGMASSQLFDFLENATAAVEMIRPAWESFCPTKIFFPLDHTIYNLHNPGFINNIVSELF